MTAGRAATPRGESRPDGRGAVRLRHDMSIYALEDATRIKQCVMARLD